MKSHERVIGRSKEIRRDRQPVFVNQPVPLATGSEQKRSPEYDGERPKAEKRATSATLQRSAREVNRQAARQQADRKKDRRFQHFARSRPGQALSDIKEIGDDEDRKDRRLRDNETSHRHVAAIRKSPRLRYFS